MQFIRPTHKFIDELDTLNSDFNTQIASSISDVCAACSWTKEDLHRMVPGIEAEQWKRYAQKSYTKIRPAHVVAALSWISQVSMSTILRGRKLNHFWDSAPSNSLKAIAQSGQMNTNTFDFFVRETLPYVRLKVSERQAILTRLKRIEQPYNDQFFAPRPLDIEHFARDYYRSTSIAIQRAREKNRLSVADMAHALSISESVYRRFENPNEKKKHVDAALAFRFKNTFHIDDSTQLLAHMQDFPQFYWARKIQEERELILKPLFLEQSEEYVTQLTDRAKMLLSHQKITDLSKSLHETQKVAEQNVLRVCSM